MGSSEVQAKSNGKAQVGIYLAALLMMGAIFVNGAFGNFAAAQTFGTGDMTQIQFAIVSIPCFAIIIVTIISGFLMRFISKKVLSLLGIVLFLVGGIIPMFIQDYTMLIVARAILGLGVGLVQVTCSALNAENYEGEQQGRVQGNINAFQMLGAMIMFLVGGFVLAPIGAEIVFATHFIAVIAFIGVIATVPNKRPVSDTGEKEPVSVSGMSWFWIIFMFIFFVGGQIYSNHVAGMYGTYFAIANMGASPEEIGAAAGFSASISLAVFAAGGIIMGLIFGKLLQLTKGLTAAFGFFLMAIGYALMAWGGSEMMAHIGSFVTGLSFSVCMPCLIIGCATAAKNGASAAFAIALITCSQSLSQALNPYIANPLGNAMGFLGGNGPGFAVGADGTAPLATLAVGVIFMVVLGIILIFTGIAQNKKAAAGA